MSKRPSETPVGGLTSPAGVFACRRGTVTARLRDARMRPVSTITAHVPAPTWRASRHVGRRATFGTGGALVSHGVRGAHTLCGLIVQAITWVDTEMSVPQCAECVSVGNHATHHDLTDIPGLTYRQLDYWVRQDWLHPDNPDGGTGSRRTFPPSEVAVAKTMAILTAAGVAASAAARAARNGGWLAPGVHVTIEPRA